VAGKDLAVTDDAMFAYLCLTSLLGGVAGHWLGAQRTIRHCRRIARSAVLDHIYREDAKADNNGETVQPRLIHMGESDR
jgi:hypothetical protein